MASELYKNVTVNTVKSPANPTTTNRAYRGLSTVNPENNSKTLYDIGLIKQDLLNHFHIRQGEKLENPEFGTIIWDALFEPLTPSMEEAIAENVKRIVNSDPRVIVNQIVIDTYESGIIITTGSYDPRNNYTQSYFNLTRGVVNPRFWEYEYSSSIDPTGSYLAPYITTIGLYDDALNMVAVAKLPEPIKSLPDYPVNFIVRFDT